MPNQLLHFHFPAQKKDLRLAALREAAEAAARDLARLDPVQAEALMTRIEKFCASVESLQGIAQATERLSLSLWADAGELKSNSG